MLYSLFVRDRSLFMGRGGPEIFEGGPLFFGESPMGGAAYNWQVPDGGGHFFLAAPIYKKPAKPNFLRVLGQNKTKKKTSKKIS